MSSLSQTLHSHHGHGSEDSLLPTEEDLAAAAAAEAEALDRKAMLAWLRKAMRLKGLTSEKWTEEHDSIGEQFLTLPEMRVLVGYMSAEGELVLLTPQIGAGLPISPKAFAFFVKKGRVSGPTVVESSAVESSMPLPERTPPLTMATIKSALHFGYINSGGVDSLLRQISDVYLPTMKATDGLWPESVKKDFVNASQRFLASLNEASNQMRGKTVLYIPSEPLPEDVKAAAKDKDLIQRLEATCIHWTRQIKEVVSNQDGASSSAGESGGPLDEINFYMSRCQDLSGITSQLKAPGLLQIVAVLREAGSSYLPPFEKLAASIQRGSDEAADNLKVLSILKGPCDNMAGAVPTDIPGLLPDILSRIRVVGAVSRYYYSSERISGLLRKVSNEVIKRCTAAVDISLVFEGDVAAVLATLEQCAACCAAWRKAFDETVAAIALNPGKRGLVWDFEPTSIFAQVEAFVQRCRDLGEICEGQQQFAFKTTPGSGDAAPLPVFGGIKGADTTRALMSIKEAFQGQMSAIQSARNDILDVKSTRWSDVNARYKAGVKELETMFSTVINEAFSTAVTVSAGIELLEAFSGLARRPAVQRAVDRKTAEVYALFGDQVTETKLYFEANMTNPPLEPTISEYAGAALWARGLQIRVEKDWKLLQRSAHFLTPCKAQQDAADAYDKLSAGLEDYMRNKYSEWLKTLAGFDHVSLINLLQTPLFARSATLTPPVEKAITAPTAADKKGAEKKTSAPKKDDPSAHQDMPFIYCNFTNKLGSMLAEITNWERFEGKFNIPFFAADIAHEYTESTRILRSHVLLAVEDYNSIISSMDEVETRLFADVIRRLDRRIAPGLVKMTWMTKNVKDYFLKDARRACLEVMTVLKSFKAQREELGNIIEDMQYAVLVDIEKNYVHDEGVFEEKQKKHGVASRVQLKGLHDNMVTTLGKMYDLFRTDSVMVQKAWHRFIKSLDVRVETALRLNLRRSVEILKRAICGDPRNKEAEIQPLFRLIVGLEGPVLEYTPTLLTLTESINDVSRKMSAPIEVVPRLDEVLPVLLPNYNASDDAIKQAIIRLQSQGTAGAQLLKLAEKVDSADMESKEKEDAELGARQADPHFFFRNISVDGMALTSIADIMSGVTASSGDIIKHKDIFSRFRELWETDKGQYMKRFAKSNPPLALFEQTINKFIAMEAEIKTEIEPSETIYFIKVDHVRVKDELVAHCRQWIANLTRLLHEIASKELIAYHERLAEATSYLMALPSNLDELARNVRLSKDFKRDKAQIEGRFAPIEAMFASLAKYEHRVDASDLESLGTMRSAWQTFASTQEVGDDLIKKAKVTMKKDTLDQLSAFQNEVTELKGLSREGLPYSGGDMTVWQAVESLNAWKKRCHELRDREKALAPAMEVFEIPIPDYPQITDCEKDIELLESIWVGVAQAWDEDYSTWKLGPFSNLNPPSLEEAAGKYKQKLLKMRDLRKWGAWTAMDNKVKEFMSLLPLIQALGNPGMRDRHWRNLMREVGVAFDPTSSDFTLEKMMDLQFPKFSDFIEELSSTANKEVAIELALKDISAVWKNMEIDLVEYKAIYWKIRSTEELFQCLEDQSVNVSSMKGSPYYPSFAKELDFWEKTLSTISEIVDLQLNVQRAWMYLESIFVASEDIKKMLPDEAALFDSVNQRYAEITQRVAKDRNAQRACSVPGYLTDLEAMDEKLERIQKALDQYLENKRQQFPRFYFVSNDDLLEILGQSKDPLQVQRHIKKCFEGINTLQLIEPGVQGNRTFEALGMNAPDGEKVSFERKVVVEGAVEAWLIEVEKCMKWALQKITGACIPAAKGKDKLKWIKEYPGQLLITTGMVYFVLNCEKQLRSDEPLKNLKTTRKRQVLLLNKLAEIVRAPLDKVSRKKVVALITMELHTRDVMERMIKANCSSTDDFEWLSQLRLEFVKSEGIYGMIVAKQTKSTLEFGYEYQGNNGRLVVTPLTDRCVLTITTALYMQRGGAPAGPAGTGKTETVKDLGKNLAKFVVVFNWCVFLQ
jgi:dynein heavy chain